MTEREERMRRSLRAIVSRAIEGESRERARIAEEIHDGALQSLLVANQDLGQPGLDPDQVDRARLALLEAIEEIRLSLTELHPTSASEQGFERALEAEARKAAARGGFEATVDVDSDAVGYHDALIVSIARELLANVAKHAEAREAVLWLGRSGAGVELTVHDDGRGVDPQEVSRALATGHLGLMIVRERVEAMGGELVISVPPLGGTIVRVLIPLDAALTGEIARLEMALARSTYPPFGERHDPRLGGSEPPGEYPRSGG
jgi:two-component system NarL family sensor kinase